MIKYDEMYFKIEKLLKAKTKAKKEERHAIQKELTEYTNKYIKPAFLKTELLDELIYEFAKVPLIYKGDKVDVSATLRDMYNNHYNLMRAQMLLAIHPTRSAFYNDSHEHGVLVPLFMMAHKKHNNVMYEVWDKFDPSIRYVVGFTLWTAIKDWLKYVPEVDDNLLELRKSIFDSSNRANKTYAGYISKAGIVNEVNVPALTATIKCQFWLANANNRTEFMLLDTVNWDNIPEAFDEETPVEEIIKNEENMYDLDFLN